ncbi:EpsG family protein [Arenibacter sp. BSSL-BM3]|uniref:EpsG family protein n=2 Tax=Arenibacter arenosicollis TaxID=2762274 RepID=A0ABR7QU61_9FLAO|nr:EpsG family protein [Arenibacter arenosicollis]
MVLVLIAGLRYHVGQDYLGYTFYYEERPYMDESIGMELEYGFTTLVNFLNDLNLEVWSFFMVSAAITYLLLFYSFKNYKHLLYLGVFFFITYGFYFYSFNGVRQAVAMSALAVAVMYAQERKIFHFFGIILLGGLMHKSLFLFFPLYFLIHRIKLPHYFWYIAFVIGLILHFIPLARFIDISFISEILSGSQIDYSGFAESMDSNEVGGLTLGYLVRVAIGFLILSYYNKLIKFNKNYLPYYNLALIGIVLYNAFSHVLVIARLNNYFLFFNIFCLAFIIHYLYFEKQKLIIHSILVFFLILFGYGIYVNENGCSPYQFIDF